MLTTLKEDDYLKKDTLFIDLNCDIQRENKIQHILLINRTHKDIEGRSF